MTNQETFNLWMDKANKGKRGYQSLSCRRDGPTYQFEGQEGAVTSLAIGVWDDRKVYHCCSWNESTPLDTSKRFFAVVKDGEGLMIAVENEGLFSFGTKNSDDDKCKAAIFFQCGCISTFITAVNDPPMFLVQDYVQDGVDPLSVILPDLLNRLLLDCQRKEVTDNAGETGPAANVDLGK